MSVNFNKFKYAKSFRSIVAPVHWSCYDFDNMNNTHILRAFVID